MHRRVRGRPRGVPPRCRRGREREERGESGEKERRERERRETALLLAEERRRAGCEGGSVSPVCRQHPCRCQVLLAKDDAEQEAEFNFITLIDLPVPPWRMPLHVWMRGMQVDLTMVGSARQGEKLLSLEWEAASPEDEARGRVGSVIICLDVDPLDVAVREAAEMQPRCSRDAAEMQPRCSRGAAEVAVRLAR